MNKNGASDYEPSRVTMTLKGYKEAVKSQNGRDVIWTTDINTELPIRMPLTGVGAEIAPITFSQIFKRVQYQRGHNSALKVQRNGRDLTWSWLDFWRDAVAFSKSMEAIGVEPRKSVNICGFNSPEWAISFFGGILHNNVSSGVYQTNTPEVRVYQALNSEAQVIVVDNLEQLKIYHSILDQLPEVKAVVAWLVDKIPQEYADDKRIHTWNDFLKLGKDVKDEVTDAIMEAQRPGMCCCLIYTSGTTGNPKGVMLSHDNLIY